MRPVLIAFLAIVAFCSPVDAQDRVLPGDLQGRAVSDQEIVLAIIAQSQSGYTGSCPCPENLDRAGRRCGKRSAYNRPGGAAPLCYPSDVTGAMITKFRASLAMAKR
jgi:hypothetical protein